MSRAGSVVGGVLRGSAAVQALRVGGAFGVAVFVVFVVMASARPAGALTCATTIDVGTSTELNEAIACYNAQSPAGSYTIRLQNSFRYSTGIVATPITLSTPGVDLTIDGGGFAVAGAFVSGGDLFTVAGSSDVVFDDVVIDEAVGDGIAIGAGAGTVAIVDSAISDSGVDGVSVKGGVVVISNSTISASGDEGVEVLDSFLVIIEDSTISNSGGKGVEASGGVVQITRSAVSNSGSDGAFGRNATIQIVDSTITGSASTGVLSAGTAGSATITNSSVSGSGSRGMDVVGGIATITNSRVFNSIGEGIIMSSGAIVRLKDSSVSDSTRAGIEARDSTVLVSNSTVSNSGVSTPTADGVAINGGVGIISNSTISSSADQGVSVAGSGSEASVVSSVVTEGCTGTVLGSNNNFTITGLPCGGSTTLTGALGPLANNGCGQPTPFGCVQTQLLADGSNAIDSGVCVDVVTFLSGTGEPLTGTLATDERGTGFARTLGLECDAGAAESPEPAVFCGGKLVTINMNLNGGNGLGTGGDDVILGTPNGDLIRSLAGDDTICGGDGGDVIRSGAGADTVFGEGGVDEIRGGGGPDTIDGGSGGDQLSGQGGADVIDGGPGGDTIDGQGSGDVLDGGSAADVINGQNGADIIDGGGGDDVLRGQAGPDRMVGGSADDDLLGGAGGDILFGGAGVDKCSGNSGPDQAEAATCETTPGVEILF